MSIKENGGYKCGIPVYSKHIQETWYVFEDVAERDSFFSLYPHLLVTDVLICIKDATPPPTPGVRSYDFSKAYNSQYKLTALV